MFSGRNWVSGLKSQARPFDISKWEVVEAWREVKANRGAPGVDGMSLDVFEKDLKNNLYKIWNRMSSGTYFPPPVRAVEIPKQHGGGTRVLGVPTVADRVAQTVVARHLTRRVERVFRPDSYGYRPGRSAHDAVEVCRRRCWKRDWVVDLDIAQFFDSVRWDLVVKAVEAHTDAAWVVLYVKRWLAAPLQLPDGSVRERIRGTPQGSAVSPVLANLYLHYAFDVWLEREFPTVQYERYADDAVIHCVSERQARNVVAALMVRMGEVGLRLHPDKTRIVYCQDYRRRQVYEHTAFTFLGFTFRCRKTRFEDGHSFWSFLPAVSKDARKRIGGEIRSWRIHLRTGLTLAEIARRINPVLAGWIQYYGRFYPSALDPLLSRVNAYLARWAQKKYNRMGKRKAVAALLRVAARYRGLFKHWKRCPPGNLAW